MASESSSPIPLRVSDKKAYVWDVDGDKGIHFTILCLSDQCHIRYRYITFTPPHLRHPDRDPSPSVAAKCILGHPTSATTRGGRSPRRQG